MQPFNFLMWRITLLHSINLENYFLPSKETSFVCFFALLLLLFIFHSMQHTTTKQIAGGPYVHRRGQKAKRDLLILFRGFIHRNRNSKDMFEKQKPFLARQNCCTYFSLVSSYCFFFCSASKRKIGMPLQCCITLPTRTTQLPKLMH